MLAIEKQFADYLQKIGFKKSQRSMRFEITNDTTSFKLRLVGFSMLNEPEKILMMAHSKLTNEANKRYGVRFSGVIDSIDKMNVILSSIGIHTIDDNEQAD